VLFVSSDSCACLADDNFEGAVAVSRTGLMLLKGAFSSGGTFSMRLAGGGVFAARYSDLLNAQPVSSGLSSWYIGSEGVVPCALPDGKYELLPTIVRFTWEPGVRQDSSGLCVAGSVRMLDATGKELARYTYYPAIGSSFLDPSLTAQLNCSGVRSDNPLPPGRTPIAVPAGSSLLVFDSSWYTVMPSSGGKLKLYSVTNNDYTEVDPFDMSFCLAQYSPGSTGRYCLTDLEPLYIGFPAAVGAVGRLVDRERSTSSVVIALPNGFDEYAELLGIPTSLQDIETLPASNCPYADTSSVVVLYDGSSYRPVRVRCSVWSAVAPNAVAVADFKEPVTSSSSQVDVSLYLAVYSNGKVATGEYFAGRAQFSDFIPGEQLVARAQLTGYPPRFGGTEFLPEELADAAGIGRTSLWAADTAAALPLPVTSVDGSTLSTASAVDSALLSGIEALRSLSSRCSDLSLLVGKMTGSSFQRQRITVPTGWKMFSVPRLSISAAKPTGTAEAESEEGSSSEIVLVGKEMVLRANY